MKTDPRTPEYRETLRAVVEALLRATADSRLPALSAEEIHHWLMHLTLEDVREAHDSLLVSTSLLSSATAGEGPELPEMAASTPAGQTCAGCGTQLPGPAKFCPECGRTVAGARLCINCNAHLQENANFCSSCGFRAS